MLRRNIFKLGLPMEILTPEALKMRKLTQKDSSTAGSSQTFEFNIPTERLIHAILISIGEDTNASGTQGTLADDIESIRLETSAGVIKELTGGMVKQIMKINKENPSTGFYKLYFTDPHIKGAMPLPSWIFSSITLKIWDNAPAESNYHHVRVSLIESEIPKGLDVSDWRLLVERYFKHEKYGSNTGWMEYKHERGYRVYGYLYVMDDDGTLSDTIFDKVRVIGRNPVGEHRLIDEVYISHIKELNKHAYLSGGLDTGYAYLEFPLGYDTAQYQTLVSEVHIPSAGTNAGLRVVERYLW